MRKISLIIIEVPDKMKKEDLTLSFLRSLAEVQGHLAHVLALAHQVRKIYFIGGFIHMELMRRYLYEEITSRNLMRPEVITNLRFTSIIATESGFPINLAKLCVGTLRG